MTHLFLYTRYIGPSHAGHTVHVLLVVNEGCALLQFHLVDVGHANGTRKPFMLREDFWTSNLSLEQGW